MKKAKLLIAEQNKNSVAELKKLLNKRNYTISIATKLSEIIRKAKDANVVLLADSYGIDTIKEIKELNPDIEIIMLTSYPSLDTAIQRVKYGATALKYGVYDYIQRGKEDSAKQVVYHAVENANVPAQE